MSRHRRGQKFQLKYNLRPHQEELLQLSQLADIHADANILKIIIELLNMKVAPEAICSMLKSLTRSRRLNRLNMNN